MSKQLLCAAASIALATLLLPLEGVRAQTLSISGNPGLLRVTTDLGVPPSGAVHGIVLIERTPNHIGVYELRYRGPDSVDVYRRLDREIDTARRFTGAPRP